MTTLTFTNPTPQTSVTLDLATVIAAVTKAGYTVTPTAVAPPTPTPPPVISTAPALLTTFAQNGTVNLAWTQDYSYSAVDSRVDASIGGNGNQYGIKVTTTGPWGGFQPSNTNGGSTDCSKGDHVTLDINAPKGHSYSTQFLKAGDQPIDAPGFTFTKSKDGWERFSCLKSQVMTDSQGVDQSPHIYKGAVQSKQNYAGDVFEVDNWGTI